MKKLNVLLHILFWIAVPLLHMLIFYSFAVLSHLNYGIPGEPMRTFVIRNLQYGLFVSFTAAAAFYLADSIVRKPKKYYRWVLLAVTPGLLVVLFTQVFDAFNWFFSYYLIKGYLLAALFAGIGLLYGVLKRNKALKMANRHAQLELIRSKTNPHFLFNTINNIDALIARDPATASSYLNKLSGMLRFMLYESDTASIPLSAEISYMQEYIKLEKIRSVNPDFIRFNIQGHAQDQHLAPMTFIPILENAFKHMGSKTANDAIVAKLDINDKTLVFSCRNTYNNTAASNGGLGMDLMKQRLDLIYGSRYQMDIKKDDHHYDVTIQLDMHAH